jgi:hypothetical protein
MIQEDLGELAGKEINRVRALTHAESHALMRAYVRQGALPSTLTINVDRITCNFCSGRNGLPLMARLLGIDELTVVSPGRTIIIP